MPASYTHSFSVSSIGNAESEERKGLDSEARSKSWFKGRHLRVLDIDLFDTTREQAASWIVARASTDEPTTVGFVNAHFVNLFFRRPLVRKTARRFDRLFADGIGVSMAARLAGIRLTENVNGTDLFPILCRKAASAQVGVYLLGGQPGVAASAAANMQTREPGLDVRGTSPGYFSGQQTGDAVIAQINASGAEILLVGMGMPVQEHWIVRNRHRLRPRVVIAVGGLFDFYSGRVRRAPALLRNNGLEWAWRLAMEPRRLFKRYVVGNAEFTTRLLARHLCGAATVTLSHTPQ
ncbi:MAG: WecB/TagA/CpsF family glycosyltransferase [Hyphomicrobiaceae bacterium]